MAEIIEDGSDWLISQEKEFDILNLPYDVDTIDSSVEKKVEEEPSAYQKRADYIRSIPKNIAEWSASIPWFSAQKDDWRPSMSDRNDLDLDVTDIKIGVSPPGTYLERYTNQATKIFLDDYLPSVNKIAVYNSEKDVAGSQPFSFITPKLPNGDIDYWKLANPTTRRGEGWKKMSPQKRRIRDLEDKEYWLSLSDSSKRMIQKDGIDIVTGQQTRDIMKPGLTQKDLLKPENFVIVEDLMKRYTGLYRKPMSLETDNAEDIVKRYSTLMRFREDYNSVHHVAMKTWLNKADQQDLLAAKKAFNLWDEKVGGILQRDATAADRIYGVAQHLRNFFIDPLNQAALFAGGRMRGAGRKAYALKASKKELAVFEKKILKNKKYTDKQKKELIDAKRNELVWINSQTGEANAQGIKAGLLTTGGLNAAFDSAVDILYQQQDIIVGREKEYNIFRTALIGTASFILGGGIQTSYAFAIDQNLRRSLKMGNNKLSTNPSDGFNPRPWLFNSFVEAGARARKSAKKFSVTEVWEAARKNGADVSMAERLKAANTRFTSFMEKAIKGAPFRRTKAGRPLDYDPALYNLFFWGDSDLGVEGVQTILERYGIHYDGKRRRSGLYLDKNGKAQKKKLDPEGRPRDLGTDESGKAIEDNYFNWLIDVINYAPKDIKSEFRKMYRTSLGTLDEFKNQKTKRPYSLEQFLLIEAANVSAAGAKLGRIGRLSQWKRVGIDKLEKGGKNLDLDEVADEAFNMVAPLAKITNYVSQAYNKLPGAVLSGVEALSAFTRDTIRAVVTNPGTTWLNIRGWQALSSLEAASRVLQFSLYGGRYMVSSTRDFIAPTNGLKFWQANPKATEAWFNKANLTYQNMVYKMYRLADLNLTVEEAGAWMAKFPQTQKLMRWANGGVEVKNMNKYLGLEDVTDKKLQSAPRRLIDAYVEKAQIIYGTKAIDLVSKSTEFMVNLDLLVRRKYGMGIDEFLEADQGNFALRNLETDAFSDILDRATRRAQKNTFSYGFGHMKSMWGQTLKLIEDLRKIPLAGGSVAFGQFFNGTMGFTADVSGLSIIHNKLRSRIAKKKGLKDDSRDIGDLQALAAVSYTTLGFATYYAHKRIFEDNLPWHMERKEDGTVADYRYEYPNLGMWLGGAVAYLHEKDVIPREYIEEGVKTFGLQQFTRGATRGLDAIYEIILEEAANPESNYLKALGEAMLMFGVNLFGMGTRPGQPLKIGIDVFGDGGVNPVDNKVGDRALNESLRYLNSVFNILGNLDQVEKRDPTSEDRMSGNPTQILGQRFSQTPTSPAQRLMAIIAKPYWKANQTSLFPEATNKMNLYISSALNKEAAKYVDSPDFLALPHDKQLDIWRKFVLSPAKASALAMLKADGVEGDERLGLLFDIDSKKSEMGIKELLRELPPFRNEQTGEVVTDISDLNNEQLKKALNWMKSSTFRLDALGERVIDDPFKKETLGVSPWDTLMIERGRR